MQRLGVLLETVTKSIVDEDPGVRKSLRQLYQTILPTVSTARFHPFMKLIMAYVVSALTHIREEVRIDALKFVHMLLQNIPDLVVMYGDKILDNYVAILSSDHSKSKRVSSSAGSMSLTVNPESQLGSHKLRLEVLTNLHDLLGHVFKSVSAPYWFFRGCGVDVDLLIDDPQAPKTFWTEPVVQHLFKNPESYLKGAVRSANSHKSTKLDIFSSMDFKDESEV
ncbi:Testis-expressed sequence 10 protein, partial [Nowakowskiella sp. JEL0078]